jgi:YHS domain-containing protein
VVRVLIYAIILILIARALAKFWRGLHEGLSGAAPRASSRPAAVQMMRDPVCGTFVVPANALTVTSGGALHYFCSLKCRDEFVSRAGRGRPLRTA